ncbi:hypothetical protein [Peribacillus sp. NPDC097295]|uniref:hypothetical protein n=1 Tax=Peribacillus sp. NPDC097295 TaxID=3364402 RepID=UPI0037F67E9D
MMKIIGVSILIFVILTVFSIGVNSLLGLDFEKSITRTFDPFKVEDTIEFAIFWILLLFFFATPLKNSIQNRKRGNKNNKKQS